MPVPSFHFFTSLEIVPNAFTSGIHPSAFNLISVIQPPGVVTLLSSTSFITLDFQVNCLAFPLLLIFYQQIKTFKHFLFPCSVGTLKSHNVLCFSLSSASHGTYSYHFLTWLHQISPYSMIFISLFRPLISASISISHYYCLLKQSLSDSQTPTLLYFSPPFNGFNVWPWINWSFSVRFKDRSIHQYKL